MGKLKEGDMVQVLSVEEIKATLDEEGKNAGLQFMAGMAKFCGTTAKVKRNVRYIFDERDWIMRKCNSVILEDVICDGIGMFDKEGCDRCCYFFWKEKWLKKI